MTPKKLLSGWLCHSWIPGLAGLIFGLSGLILGRPDLISGGSGLILGNSGLIPGNSGLILGNSGLIPGNSGLIPGNSRLVGSGGGRRLYMRLSNLSAASFERLPRPPGEGAIIPVSSLETGDNFLETGDNLASLAPPLSKS